MVIPDNYKKVLAQFRDRNEKKPIYLFAILKMDELVDKWSIIISIDWMNNENRQDIFSTAISALQDQLSAEELNEVARISFYAPDEHLMELFFDKFEEGQHIKEDAKVNGNVVHEGYILLLDKNPESSSQSSLDI